MKLIFKIIFFLLSVVAFSVSAEDVDLVELESRSKARWEKIINHDFGGAYEFATPNYKAVFTKDLYVSQFGHATDWNLTKIEDIQYDPVAKVATVIVLVETKPRNSKGLESVVKTADVEIREKWLHIKGRWWHSSNE